MHIDPQAATRSAFSSTVPLTPELEKLVTDFKLSLGQRLDVLVSKTSPVTTAERAQLLELHKPAALPAQRQLQTLLHEPALKMVELKVQQHLFSALTTLSVAKNQELQVLLTPRGLMLLPPQAPATTPQHPVSPSQTPGSLAQPMNSSARLPAPTLAANVSSNGATPGAASNLSAAATGKLATSASSPDSSLARPTQTPSQAPIPTDLPRAAAASSSRNLEGMPQLSLGPKESPEPTKTAKTTAPVAADAQPKTAAPTLRTDAQPLLANALARALPLAQEMPPLLRAIAQFQAQMRQLPAEAQPPELRQLNALFNKLNKLDLNVAQLDPTRPQPLRQAIMQSGAFYEARLIRTAQTEGRTPLAEQDVKGVLVQLQQWLNAQQTPNVVTRPGGDALSQLFLGLAQLFSPRQRSQADGPPAKPLMAAVQQLVDRSLAQVQTQQYRTLNHQLLDPAAPSQWHLDIPLRLPDGYGNLYLQMFEPRHIEERDKDARKQKPQRQNKGRWRVFMELTLDELGGMAAEISVLEQNLDVTLWAENGKLRDRANAHLRKLRTDLENQGLVVNELHCSESPPPTQKMRLDYALIDVKT